jgi:hypothetical protein
MMHSKGHRDGRFEDEATELTKDGRGQCRTSNFRCFTAVSFVASGLKCLSLWPSWPCCLKNFFCK